MDRSQPQLKGQYRRRRGGTISRSSSSSYARSSDVIQSNKPPNNVKPSTSTPNINNTRAIRDDGTEDETLPAIIGTCPLMCPVEEKERRERLRDLAVFERLYGNPGKTSSSLAVKKFCRTISTKDVQPSHVRPLPVLEDTLNYLFDLLGSSESFEALHEFIFDRTRSIRQDLSMQNIISYQAVNIYERLVKFHVISLHKLRKCTNDPTISPMHNLNMEQLMKTLASLYNLYEANRKSQHIFANEAEFRSFYVLLHLGSDSQPMGESLSLWFSQVPSPILKSKEMIFARRILRYFRLGNYKRFIRTIEAEASSLQYCIIEPYIIEVRAVALSCVNHGGYKLHPYPLTNLSKLLLMKETDLESFCTDCGLMTTMDEDGRRFLPTKQTSFCHPKKISQNHYPLDSERLTREFAQPSVLKWLQT